MDCCDRTVYDDVFDARQADRRLRDYRRRGPNRWTARLIEELEAGGVDGMTVLEIGAGIGAVHHALLSAGAASAIDVDASGPYLAASRREAERRGLADRVTYHKGDVVQLAGELPVADIVALDRVVCCYPDMTSLVRVAAERTRRRLGLVLPRDTVLVRGGVAIANGFGALTRDPFRIHAHRTLAVLEIARSAGLQPVATHRGVFWQSLILERRAA
ncbi:MAG TPA: methyltransferase domain-containing protein [Candidatus Limnocylindrales bacterium]|nr:methyltransferase domain-containing protein [Candidatus Limnocylindrales bacterium]